MLFYSIYRFIRFVLCPVDENKTTDVQVKKLIDRLSHLVEDVAEYFAPAPPIPILGPLLKSMDEEDYRRCRTEFDTKLMRLKCLDEHNKMIPYFEKKAEEWDYKKAGLLGKIAKVLKK